jgi:hypothetical protein
MGNLWHVAGAIGRVGKQSGTPDFIVCLVHVLSAVSLDCGTFLMDQRMLMTVIGSVEKCSSQ